jgi:hypothetical protein
MGVFKWTNRLRDARAVDKAGKLGIEGPIGPAPQRTINTVMHTVNKQQACSSLLAPGLHVSVQAPDAPDASPCIHSCG